VKLPYHLIGALRHRLLRPYRPSRLAYAQVVGGRTWACTDLGAFPRPLPRLEGLEGVVIMEDRDPEFFLSFRDYDPSVDTRLNRHGPLRGWSTHEDLRDLVGGLHEQRTKVAIGFWNYGGWLFHIRPPWLRAHPEIKRLWLSSQLYPFVRLRHEGVDYGHYIADQYRRLHQAFGFDGLMLGDGFCGFASIWDPDRFADREGSVDQWAGLYQGIAASVHDARGILLAYDAMGFPPEEASKHGVDYRRLVDAGLDILVYQSYPQAWGRYWLETYRRRFDLVANVKHLGAVRAALEGTAARILYTLEIGDSVERWRAEPALTRKQAETLDPLADGRFLVWANDVFARRGRPASS